VLVSDVANFIAKIVADSELGHEVVHHEVIAAREAQFGQFSDLPPGLLRALEERNVERPWAHQAKALQLIEQGKNVAIVTPTASGKSLVYSIPVIARALCDGEKCSRALFVFPLKALEQDQLRMLDGLCEAAGLGGGACAIMDGDTPQSLRKKLKANPPAILLTTPDMLHFGILPHHQAWEELFSTLSVVVLDELHTYRGIFGSHVSQIAHRLARMAEHYGSTPQWIVCSATIANPREFAENLLGMPFEVVEENSAPRAVRHFLFVNPTVATSTRAATLFARCLDARLRTIVFTKARKLTELIHLWVTDSRPDLSSKVSAYRSGYLPEERREIEGALSSGKLLGVISTSALEMGIDIGGLDVCILVGYPGTIASTWQRGGRVGRGEHESLVILLGGADVLDQYFMKHPGDFFKRGAEAAVVDPDNEPILEAHLPCAAAELPLELDDGFMQVKERLPIIARLENAGTLLRAVESETWFAARRNPHRFVNLRDVGEGFTISLDEPHRRGDESRPKKSKTIGTISFGRALKECHEGAVYLHRGSQYVVRRLDLERHNIFVAKSRARYYTQAKADKETTIIEPLCSQPFGNVLMKFGVLEVEEQIIGYEKRRLRTGEKMSLHALELPAQTFETRGIWFEFDDFLLSHLRRCGHTVMGSMHALEHAAIALFPLFVYCDRFDVGGICYPVHPQLRKGAVFIYDGYPGGVGLARKAYDVIEALLERVIVHLTDCSCEEGCPSCIYSPKCGADNKPLDKRGCILLARLMLGLERVQVVDDTLESVDSFAPIGSGDDALDARDESGPQIVYFDLETRRGAQEVGGWNNIHLMRLAVGCVWDSRTKEYYDYYEEDAKELIAHLARADLVVGFNNKRFDYRVLSAYGNHDFARIKTFDILEAVHRQLGYRLSLGHLGEKTLARPKTADGLQSLAWFKEGRMDLIVEYCRADVALTRDLFLHGVEHSELRYEKKGAGLVRLPVGWSIDEIVAAALEEANSRERKGSRRGFRGRR